MIKFKFIVLFLLILTGLNSCGLYERADVKDNPINIDERVQKALFRKIDAMNRLGLTTDRTTGDVNKNQSFFIGFRK